MDTFISKPIALEAIKEALSGRFNLVEATEAA